MGSSRNAKQELGNTYPRDDSVKNAPSEPKPMLPGGQFPKVLRCPGNDVIEQLEQYSPGRLGINRHVKLHEGLGS
jgi:hypothetical protein